MRTCACMLITQLCNMLQTYQFLEIRYIFLIVIRYLSSRFGCPKKGILKLDLAIIFFLQTVPMLIYFEYLLYSHTVDLQKYICVNKTKNEDCPYQVIWKFPSCVHSDICILVHFSQHRYYLLLTETQLRIYFITKRLTFFNSINLEAVCFCFVILFEFDLNYESF